MASIGNVRPGQPEDQPYLYSGSKGFLRQELINGRLNVQYGDGTQEVVRDLSPSEIYPAHAPARGLVDLVRGTAENRAPGEFGARVVEFLEAAYQSAATGKPVRTDSLY